MKLWIRIDAALRSDPNVAELANRLNITTPEAVGHCVLVWSAIAEHRPDGNLAGISSAALEDWAGYRKRRGKPAGAFTKVFREIFLSDQRVKGWQDRQGKLIEKAEKERARKLRGTSAEEVKSSAPTERNGTERDGTEAVVSSKHLSGAVEEQTAPRVVLPPEANRFLATFYEPALTETARQRYRDVKAQLYDVLDPLHKGPKIAGGVRVKARSVQHLADTMKIVMNDPPMDRNAAIVFLLKKLTNPAKGPSEAEVATKNEGAKIALEERHQEARRQAGLRWAKENPDEYEKIVRVVDANLAGASGSFVEVARKAQLAQLCAEKAEFPPFEKWLETRSAA